MRDVRKARARSLRRAAELEEVPRRLRGALRLLAESGDDRREIADLVRALSPFFRRDGVHEAERAIAIERVEALTARILGAR